MTPMIAGRKKFVFLLYPEVSIFTLAAVIEIYQQALLEAGGSGRNLTYDFALVSSNGVRTAAYFDIGLDTVPVADAQDMDIDTLFVCGGAGYAKTMRDPAVMDFLHRNGPRVRRLCAAGSGTFILASAGLLDGKRAVTHWLMHDELVRSFPQIRVVRDMLHLQDGHIWTSAGIGSAIDLALALLEEDEGRAFAYKIARRVLVPLRRSGHQPQISSLLDAQALEGGRFDRLHEWIQANLRSNLSVDVLASHVAMSPRNFSRVYRTKMGTTPARAITMFRLEAARSALLSGDEPLSTVAYACGFENEQKMRRAFLRWLGQTPTELRARRDDQSNARPSLSGAGTRTRGNQRSAQES